MAQLPPTRKRIVHGHGPKNARILIVGEAPGAEEDRTGKPFVGSAGELLEQLLNQAQIHRSECYITNVIKERPPGNDISKFISLDRKITTTDEYIKYRLYLLDEIHEINPHIIIAAGNVSLYALTGERGITKWRGSLLEGVTGHKVMPILHPASALREYMNRHFISFDLKRAKKEAETREIVRTERSYITSPTFHQSVDYLNQCKSADLVGFDIEVSHKEVSCISFARSANSAISIPFTKNGEEYFSVEQEYIIWKIIGELLESPKIEKVAQNASFDTTFLFRRYGIKCQNIHDTMIAMAILFPDFPKSLGFITSIYTDMPYYKDERKSMDSVVPDEDGFWMYNAKDSIVLVEALPKMMAELDRMDLRETYDHQRRLLGPILYMTEQGIRMDVDNMREEALQVQGEILEIEQKINEVAGYEINSRSVPQLKQYFYGDKRQGGLGIRPYLKDGKPTTDEGALIRLARGTSTREPSEVARLLLRHRSLSKLKGTYLDMSLDEDDRVRTAMNPVGARTGRLSSSKTIFGTGANLQNQPPIMKNFMLIDDDHIGYEIDLGQAENRIVAYVAPEPKMIEAFETGADVHSRTASYIFNLPEKEISRMNKEGVMCDTIGDGSYTHRFWGKKANHAFNYGQGYKKFAYQVEIPEDEGQMIHEKYHSAYPGVRKYHEWIKGKLSKDRTLENLMGRKYMFLDRWSHQMFEAAFAFIPQSTVSDIINRRGLIPIYEDQDKYAPVKILNQVHDSIVIQISKRFSAREHARCILGIAKSLEHKLIFRGREFVIPCDLKILPTNLKDGEEISNVVRLSIEELTEKIDKVKKDGEDK